METRSVSEGIVEGASMNVATRNNNSNFATAVPSLTFRVTLCCHSEVLKLALTASGMLLGFAPPMEGHETNIILKSVFARKRFDFVQHGADQFFRLRRGV